MSKLDDILGQHQNQSLKHGWTLEEITEEAKQQVKALMFELISEVQNEAFKVNGSINANDLMQRGFNQFDKQIRQKVNEL